MLKFDEPMTRSELARALQIDRTTLWQWQRKGLIPAPDRVSGNRSMFSPLAQRRAAALVEARSWA